MAQSGGKYDEEASECKHRDGRLEQHDAWCWVATPGRSRQGNRLAISLKAVRSKQRLAAIKSHSRRAAMRKSRS